jgi:uncharacterized protein (TIGR00251 family)
VVGGTVERPGTGQDRIPGAAGPGHSAQSPQADHRVLIVAVAAPAVDGKANEAVRRAVAEAFGVRARDVTVVSGERSRDKVLEIDGADEARLAELRNA